MQYFRTDDMRLVLWQDLLTAVRNRERNALAAQPDMSRARLDMNLTAWLRKVEQADTPEDRQTCEAVVAIIVELIFLTENGHG